MASASKVDLTKEREDLVKANALLDDVHFPRPSHFDDQAIKCCEIAWLRPSVISKDPDVYAFDTDKLARIDFFKTGVAFDWLLVPLAHICLYPSLLYNLLSSNEGFTKNYGGMFKVRCFCCYLRDNKVIRVLWNIHSSNRAECLLHLNTIDNHKEPIQIKRMMRKVWNVTNTNILIFNEENPSSRPLNYVPITAYRFYSFGKWLKIVIDDRFPFHTCSPPTWSPYFVNNGTGYWISLILKAYAKLHGSYDKLVNGRICEAYTEFTGGLVETYEMNNLPTKFHISLKKFYDSSCLLAAVSSSTIPAKLPPSPGKYVESRYESLCSFAYCYLGGDACSTSDSPVYYCEEYRSTKYVYEENDSRFSTSYWAMVDLDCKTNYFPSMKTGDLTVKLLYIFTVPNGHTVADEVSCPKLMKILMKINSRDNDEGAYWITYKDFKQNFATLYVCTFDRSLLYSIREPRVKWNMHKYNGTWFTMDSSSSHSLYDPSSIPFWSFDQLKFELRDSDSYKDDKRCEFLVCLQQPGELYNPNVALIGFFIFRLVRENERVPVKKEFFKLYRPLTYAIEHGKIVQTRLKLPQGSYMIIPVAEPENHNDYFLTLLTEAAYNVWGFVPKYRASVGTSPYSWRREATRPKYSHLKRVSREPSRTPSPSQLIPNT